MLGRLLSNGFDKETSINNALTADSIEDLNILSNSYMYNATTTENDDGTYNVVMSMKDLSSINDENMASYYKENYDNENNPTDMVIVEPLRGIITKNNWLENNGEKFPHTKYFMKEIHL